MPNKIGPRVALRHYILEHLKAHDPPLSQRELADRLECDEMTVSRWVRYKVKVTPDILAAIADALGGDLMDWKDLLHHPDQPSADQLLRRLPEDDQKFWLKQLKTAAKQAS